MVPIIPVLHFPPLIFDGADKSSLAFSVAPTSQSIAKNWHLSKQQSQSSSSCLMHYHAKLCILPIFHHYVMQHNAGYHTAVYATHHSAAPQCLANFFTQRIALSNNATTIYISIRLQCTERCLCSVSTLHKSTQHFSVVEKLLYCVTLHCIM